MVTLNAAAIENEDQIGQTEQPAAEQPETKATAAPIRTITIPMPESCQTRIQILLQQPVEDESGWWRAGYRIARDYDPGDAIKRSVEELPPSANEDEGYETIGKAVVATFGNVQWWLDTNRRDDDEHASEAAEAVETWFCDFDEKLASESLFDDATDAKKNAEPDKPVSDTDAAQTSLECETAAIATPTLPPAGYVETATPTLLPSGCTATTVTDEAQRHFDERKRCLEEQIGKLAIEEANLKAKVKANREAKNGLVEDLQLHILRGPERLPLFDRTSAPEATTPQAAEAETTEAGTAKAETAEPSPLPPNAESCIKVKLNATIEGEDYSHGDDSPEIKFTAGKAGDVLTAYLDGDGDVFLALPPADGIHGWLNAFLEDDEYEQVETDPAVLGQSTASPTDNAPPADKEAWREDRIADVLLNKCGVTPKIVEILEGHDIRTLGDLANAPLKKGCELTQLKGITESRLSKIQDATDAYWAAKKGNAPGQ